MVTVTRFNPKKDSFCSLVVVTNKRTLECTRFESHEGQIEVLHDIDYNEVDANLEFILVRAIDDSGIEEKFYCCDNDFQFVPKHPVAAGSDQPRDSDYAYKIGAEAYSQRDIVRIRELVNGE